MNHHQLLKCLGEHPKHSIHRVEHTQTFNRWRTFTFQDPGVGGRSFSLIRQVLLDQLYEDWQRFRSQTIELNL